MSRNLSRSDCDQCGAAVRVVGTEHAIKPEEAGPYFREYEGMIVADAECAACEAKYIAWLDGSKRVRSERYPAPDGGIRDLSYRSTFNDEPGPGDVSGWGADRQTPDDLYGWSKHAASAMAVPRTATMTIDAFGLCRTDSTPALHVARIGSHALPLPARATADAAGLDLRNAGPPVVLLPGVPRKFPCGFAFEIPRGWEGQVRGRSGLADKHQVTVFQVGTIDSDYRGEVSVLLVANVGEYRVETGERIAQMVISPVSLATCVEVDALSETARGAGGYGSTGAM